MGTDLTLEYLFERARLWCPKRARWDPLLTKENSWGPAHELAHALIEPRWRWAFGSYSRCSIGFCRCPRELCMVYEAAAMLISGTILRTMDQIALADLEIESTPDYDRIEPNHFKQAKTLLRRKRLWPVPRTCEKFDAALVRRLRCPRGTRRKLSVQATVVTEVQNA